MNKLTFSVLLLATFAAPAGASDVARLARKLGKAAHAAGLKRVAVFEFKSASGADSESGAALRDALLVELTRDGRVAAVDRGLRTAPGDAVSLLDAGTASVEPGALHRAPVEGVLVGSYERDGRRLRIFARLVRLSDRRVVAAGRAEEAADDADFAAAPAPGGALASGADENLKDSLYAIAQDCADASARVRHLEAPVVALESRYWALRLRLDAEGTRRAGGPGAALVDAGLRARFESELRAWRSRSAIPPMTAEELSLLADAEKESSDIARDCRL